MKAILRKLSCSLGIHTWLRWGKPYTIAYIPYQTKCCEHCGKVVRRCLGM